MLVGLDVLYERIHRRVVVLGTNEAQNHYPEFFAVEIVGEFVENVDFLAATKDISISIMTACVVLATTDSGPLLILVVGIPANTHDHGQDIIGFTGVFSKTHSRVSKVHASLEVLHLACDSFLGQICCSHKRHQTRPRSNHNAVFPTCRTAELFAAPLEAVLNWATHIDRIRR